MTAVAYLLVNIKGAWAQILAAPRRISRAAAHLARHALGTVQGLCARLTQPPDLLASDLLALQPRPATGLPLALPSNLTFVPLCSVLSEAAYTDPQGFVDALQDALASCPGVQAYLDRAWMLSLRPQFVDARPAEDTQAYVLAQAPATVFVVFRGTSSNGDTRADLDMRRVQLPGGARVHHGFYAQYLAVRADIRKLICEHAAQHGGPLRIICTGHSLGGALATLAAHDLGGQCAAPGGGLHGSTVACYTFGSPRVGDNAFVRAFEGVVHSHVRVFNEEDPVPMMPITGRFCHVGNGVSIDDALKVRLLRQDDGVLRRVMYSLGRIDMSAGIIRDHCCALYVQRTLGLMRAAGLEPPEVMQP